MKKILVVEDDEDSRDMLATVLMDEGYTVETAANGRLALQALEAMPTGDPALVILDVLMPEMSGLEVLTTLKDEGKLPHMNIVVLSATPFLAKGFGARQILRKPISLDGLVALVREYTADAPPSSRH